jgi:hypothetical protein
MDFGDLAHEDAVALPIPLDALVLVSLVEEVPALLAEVGCPRP